MTLSAGASPVRTLAQPEKARASKARAQASGKNTPGLLAKLGPDGFWLKTSARLDQEALEPFCETWPRSGMMQNGIASQLAPLVPNTKETGFGLWPTPTADGERPARDVAKLVANNRQINLSDAVRMWPTGQRSRLEGHNSEVFTSRLGARLAENIAAHRASDIGRWEIEPALGRVANGFSGWVGEIRALGNAVVPQIPEIIGEAIIEYELKE